MGAPEPFQYIISTKLNQLHQLKSKVKIKPSQLELVQLIGLLVHQCLVFHKLVILPHSHKQLTLSNLVRLKLNPKIKATLITLCIIITIISISG